MAGVKRLAFAEWHLNEINSGSKQITLRKYREGAHDFIEGELVLAEFEIPDIGKATVALVMLADTEITTFVELKDEAAREDGFKDALDAFVQMTAPGAYYEDMGPDDPLAVVRFELAPIKLQGN